MTKSIDERYFGQYGGRYIPEVLRPAFEEIEESFNHYSADPAFNKELDALFTDGVDGDDPIIAIDWPRPDFRIATLELLIGLLALAAPPRDLPAWLAAWRKPPPPEELDVHDATFTVTHLATLTGLGGLDLRVVGHT